MDYECKEPTGWEGHPRATDSASRTRRISSGCGWCAPLEHHREVSNTLSAARWFQCKLRRNLGQEHVSGDWRLSRNKATLVGRAFTRDDRNERPWVPRSNTYGGRPL